MKTQVLINGEVYGTYATQAEAERIAESLRTVWWAGRPTITTRAV